MQVSRGCRPCCITAYAALSMGSMQSRICLASKGWDLVASARTCMLCADETNYTNKKSKSMLRDHIARHFPGTFPCTVQGCHYKAVHQRGLKDHQKNKHGGQPQQQVALSNSAHKSSLSTRRGKVSQDC